MIKNLLTIAGSDPSGGAGIQADLKTFSALGAYGMSVITALTAQNTQGVRSVHIPPQIFIKEQIEALQEDITIDAIKIGMIGNLEILDVITEFLKTLKECPVVLDPVMVAQSGDMLVDQSVIEAMISKLFPLTTIITPNIPEAKALTGAKDSDFKTLTEALKAIKTPAILLKGGHDEPSEKVRDVLLEKGQGKAFEALRVETKNNHGTGCTLSSAIAVYLAQGQGLSDAVQKAKTYVTDSLKHAEDLNVGKGAGPVHHFYALWGKA